MTPEIDAGSVLVEGSVPVDPRRSLADAVRRKAAAAAQALPEVLERMVRGEEGAPQRGEPGYFSRSDALGIIRVEHPEELTAGELLRRVWAFGLVRMTIGGVVYPVTRLRPARPRDRAAVRTADALVLAPDRLDWMTPGLWRMRRRR